MKFLKIEKINDRLYKAKWRHGADAGTFHEMHGGRFYFKTESSLFWSESSLSEVIAAVRCLNRGSRLANAKRDTTERIKKFMRKILDSL